MNSAAAIPIHPDATVFPHGACAGCHDSAPLSFDFERAERDFLASCGIALMQGYWFSKPVFQARGYIPDDAWN